MLWKPRASFPGWGSMLLGVGWGRRRALFPAGEGACIWEYVSWRSDICLQAEGSTVSE